MRAAKQSSSSCFHEDEGSIPLLELLDSMGVTRRKGSVRDIL
ncbi:MAG: SelB C-terminal domain-containing protein [Acidobacteria bacterium]|nr:SelB C-terminal domain-containing protein [Acidobacteriota bacterium]